MLFDLLASFKSSDGLKSSEDLSHQTTDTHETASPCDSQFDGLPRSDDDKSEYESMEIIAFGGERASPPQHRFVAGSTFFNYDACGSLRPDKSPIDLFTAQYVGLAIHVTLVGFVFHFFSYGFGRLLAEYLKANDEQQVHAANSVLIWPQELVIFIGLLSDSYPICGYRRKSYMVFGWVLSLTMYIAIFTIDVFGNSGDKLFASTAKDEFDSTGVTPGKHASRYAIAYLVASLVAAIGIQFSWIGAVIASVELAQRESIHPRGKLQGALLALYYFGGFAAKAVTSLIISQGVNKDHWVSTVSMGQAAILLAGVSVFAIPFVLFCFDEDKVPPRTSASEPELTVGDRVSRFWKFCHYNIVYRILFFLGLQLFLLGMFNQNVRDAVEEWSGVSRKGSLLIEIGRMGAMVLSTIVWRNVLRNVSWHKCAFWGPAGYILLYVILTLCTTFDLVRNQWFYGIILTIADFPRAWIVLFAVIIATEITEVGHEGVTVTLGMSFQVLAGVADYTLAAIYPGLFGVKVTMDQVRDDDAETRRKVAVGFAIIVAFNLCNFVCNLLLPEQKLDAQQMRVFGGYNRFAGPALLVLFVVLICFNLAANLASVL